MGNRLAEMQLRVLWEEITQRFDHIELVGDVERLPNNFIRGVKDVPVRLHSHQGTSDQPSFAQRRLIRRMLPCIA
jgi:hypothetical protein